MEAPLGTTAPAVPSIPPGVPLKHQAEEQRLRAINKVEAEGAPTSRTLFRNARTAWAAPVPTEPLDSEEQRLLLNNEERLRESLVLYANRALTEERHSA